MKTFTVVTYNIHHGHDVDLDYTRLAKTINETGADLIGIQEVDTFTARVGGRNTLEELASAAGFAHSFFTPAMDYDGGQYGTAILSKFPIESSTVHDLYDGGSEPRSVGIAEVITPDGTRLRIVNTHLCVDSSETRGIQIKQIAYRCGELLDGSVPTVITGDFNTEVLNSFAPFVEYGYETVNGSSERYPTFRPSGIAIDHIFYRREQMILEDCRILDRDTSDHNPLVCMFTLL